MADLARLTEIIEPEAQALGFDLVRVKMMPSEAGDGTQALQIMAEDPATGQLVIEQCAALSRAVSEQIDARVETEARYAGYLERQQRDPLINVNWLRLQYALADRRVHGEHMDRQRHRDAAEQDRALERRHEKR